MPVGQSAIGFRGGLLLILLLNVRVDGQLVTLIDVFGDGTFGEIFVTPGVHTWSISNAADTEVLASGTVDCPECNAVVVEPTPSDTPPASDTLASSSGRGSSPLALLLILLAVGTAGVVALTPRKGKTK